MYAASNINLVTATILLSKSTVKPPYNDMGYITISSILRSTPLIETFLVYYYDILAFGNIVKVFYQYRYN